MTGSKFTALSSYQVLAHKTGNPDATVALLYAIPALAEEVGEVCKLFAKTVRDEHKPYGGVDRTKLEKELGDVLWMVAEIATATGLDLERIAQVNIEKLQDRADRSVIHGSGDDR